MSNSTELTRKENATATRRDEQRQQDLATLTPPVDVLEDGRGIILWADLPGVMKDKLSVNVRDGNLYIEAQATVPTPQGLRLQHAELREPRFARAFAVSADFDISKIDANLKDGVLQLTIPRRDEAQPRRIEVKTG